MAEKTPEAALRRGLSTDAWAVLIAVALALLVRYQVIGAIPW
jgi:hypothetical protein